MRRHRARAIQQVDIDFLCLSIFGQRALPDDMAARIAERREFYRGAADAFDRHPDLVGSPSPESVEAVAV